MKIRPIEKAPKKTMILAAIVIDGNVVWAGLAHWSKKFNRWFADSEDMQITHYFGTL